MSKARSVSFFNLCRVCTSSDDQKVDVFSNESKSKNLCAKANECLPLNMEETDHLPKMLCLQCVQNVESFIAFRNLCRNSQTKLSDWLYMASDKKETKIVNPVCDTNVPDYNSTSYNNFINNISSSSTSTTAQPNALTHQTSNLNNTNLNSASMPITVSAIPPLASLGGNNDLTNSVMQTITLQQPPHQQHLQDQQHTVETEKDKILNNNSLQEFLKLKPNLKVTAVNKRSPQQQQTITHQQQQDQLQLQQLQQQLQMQLQQLQQQQLQQQLQLLTAQIHPQQITITAPNATLTPLCTNGTIINGNNSNSNISDSSVTSLSNGIHTLSGDSDDNSCSINKKPKINFVITSPNNNQTLNNSASTSHFSTIPSQIQLQLQSPQNQQQQIQNNVNTGSFLSNLAPLLQQQSQGATLNAVFQNQPILQPTTSTATTMLPSNKCYLPITIRDESTDQQFVAHIDAKNFILPTTYQLQMKLQPQIATADGQPIMQLAPTSIPATLQITPQNLPTGTGLTPTALTALGGNLLSSAGQLISIQPSLQQNCQQQLINIQQASPIQQQELIQSEQQQQKQTKFTNRNLPSSSIREHIKSSDSIAESNNLNGFQTTNGNKIKLVPQTTTNTNDMESGNNFSQQIMQQIQQAQNQESFNNVSTIQTLHGGVTVQRIKTSSTPTTAATSTALTILNKKSPTQFSTSKVQNTNITKLPIINKQNITISRITPQTSGSAVMSTTKGHIQQSQNIGKKLSSNTIGLDGGTTKTLHTTAMTGIVKKNTRPIANEISTNTSKGLEFSSTLQNSDQSSEIISLRQNTSNKMKATSESLPQKKAYKRTKNADVDISTSQSNKITLVDINALELAKPTKNNIVVTSKPSSETPPRAIIKKLATNKVIVNLNTNKETKVIPTPSSAVTSTTSKTTLTTSKSMSSNDAMDSNFQCVTCNRIFKKKELLTQHAKLHAGVRPFKCTEEGCQKAFSRKEHLHRHLISHTGKKMFSCDFCQKPFSRKDNLSKHRKAHTEPGAKSPYNCNICNKSFAVKSYFEQHKLKHQKMAINNDDNKKDCKELLLAVKQVSVGNLSNGINNSVTTAMPQIANYNESRVMIQQPEQSHQIMHLQLPSSIVSTAANNLVGNTITITETYPGNNNHISYKNLQANNNSIHDTTVLNLPTSLASFVQQAQIVDTTTGQIMGHVKIQK